MALAYIKSTEPASVIFVTGIGIAHLYNRIKFSI